MTEKIIPDGYKLVAVKGLDELVYWLDRCKYKRHLENCPDLIEPFEAFEYRNVSEEAVIATHEAKAAPAVPFDEREAFEREMRSRHGWNNSYFTQSNDGGYLSNRATYAYIGWQARAAIEKSAAKEPAVPQGEPVHQFRKVHCADWYDGHPDHGDGGGPYEERTLYTAQSQPVPFDQWNSSPYTQVLHETIKDLSQKLASMTQSQLVTDDLDMLDVKVSAGLCQVTADGKHAYLREIQSIIATLREKE